MHIEINLNVQVKFMPTSEGMKMLMGSGRGIQSAGDGYYVMQLWELMQLFGPQLNFGTDCQPFAGNNIIVDVGHMVAKLP